MNQTELEKIIDDAFEKSGIAELVTNEDAENKINYTKTYIREAILAKQIEDKHMLISESIEIMNQVYGPEEEKPNYS